MRKKLWIAQIDSDNFKTLMRRESVENWMDILNAIKDGNLILENWIKNIYLDFDGSEESVRKPIPDFARGIILKALSNRARLLLTDLIQEQVEFLPFETNSGLYFEMNVKQIKCINEKLSTSKYYPSSNKIMRIEKYSFYLENLSNIHIFYAKEIGINPLFISNDFKELVEENNLTGLTFHPVPLIEE